MEFKRKHTLRDLLYLPLRNKATIGTIFLAALCVSLIYCIVMPATYRAETKLVVKGDTSRFSGLDQHRPDSYVTRSFRGEQQMAPEIEIIKGEYLTEKVVARVNNRIEPLRTGHTAIRRIADGIRSAFRFVLAPLGLSTTPSDPIKRMVLTFLDRLHVTNPPGTEVVSIAFDWTDPHSAALVANTYADEYAIQQSLLNDSRRLYEFYKDQAGLLEKKLQDAEKQHRTLLGGSPVPEQDILVRSIADITTRINRTDTEIGEIRTRISKIREMTKRPSAWVEGTGSGGRGRSDGYLRSLDRFYVDLRKEREFLLKDHSPDDLEVRAVDNRLESLRIQKIDGALEVAAMELSVAKIRRSILAKQLTVGQKRLRALRPEPVALQRFDREKDLIEKDYRVYRRSAEDLRIANDLEALKISNVKVLTPAVPPIVPTSPRSGTIIFYAGLGGILLGLLFSGIKECFDHTFREDDQVARILDIPLLLSVPDQTHGPVAASTRGAANGGAARLRRMLGQELRRPLWGNRSAKNGTIVILSLLLAAVCLFYLHRSFASPRPFTAERAFVAVRNDEETVSFSSVYPPVWSSSGNRESPLSVPARGESTLLSEEVEKQRVDLYRRHEKAEAVLEKIRPEGQ
jgi:uncharacterized protein involved in exopolysaccharide biosynthesis